MFAVPGWSVSASSLVTQAKTQPASDTVPKASKIHRSATGPNAEIPNAKKRKREAVAEAPPAPVDEKITKKNFESLWKKHIEKQDGDVAPASSSRGNAKQRKQEKKERLQQRREAEEEAAAGGETQDDDVDAYVKSIAQQGRDDRAAKQADAPVKKRKTLKEKKAEKKAAAAAAAAAGGAVGTGTTTSSMPPAPPVAALTPLQSSMRQKLLSSRFRHLNETLYTTPSSHAFKLFTESPELFTEYHTGFARQVQESWPENPVTGYIAAIKRRGAVIPSKANPKAVIERSADNEPLPRRPSGLCTIADLGCGDAAIAKDLKTSKTKNIRVLSYDLYSTDPTVTKADIANLPLPDGGVDLAIFCLSLMGTNWIDFVEETWRILRGDGRGEVWVSEVKSRFGKVKRKGGIGTMKPQAAPKQRGNAKKISAVNIPAADEELFVEDHSAPAAPGAPVPQDEETDISAFVEVFRTRGFALRPDSVDMSNKMFVRMEFVKTAGAIPSRGKYAGQDNSPAALAAKKNGDNPNKMQQRQGMFGMKHKQTKFVEETVADEKVLAEEAKVLKPCVYKIR